jgi:plastocyanin
MTRMELIRQKVHWLKTLSFVCLVGFIFTACAPSTGAAASRNGTPAAPTSAPSRPPSTANVNIVEPPFKPPQQWKYDPSVINIKVGTKIEWTNTGAVLHTITADDGTTFDSGNLEPKATFSFLATSPGTITYHCSFHAWMTGTIVVSP